MKLWGWVSLVCLGISTAALAASPEDYVGHWRSLENPATTIRFDTSNNTLVGNLEVLYTFPNGQLTGKKIEYYYSYPETLPDNSLRGALTTYDSHYGCFFENGETTLELLGPSLVKMVSQHILFVIQEYTSPQEFRYEPRYCYSQYWGESYFCGYERRIYPSNVIPYAPVRRDCVVTQRIPTVNRLERIQR